MVDFNFYCFFALSITIYAAAINVPNNNKSPKILHNYLKVRSYYINSTPPHAASQFQREKLSALLRMATSPTSPTKFEYQQLLSNKPDWKELHQAVSKGDVEKITKLMKRKQINLREDRRYTKILLRTAIQKDNGKVLEVLFEKGAKVGGFLFTAVRQNAFECVKTIVRRLEIDKEEDDLDPTQTKEEGFLTPLMMALQSNNYDIVEYFIVKGYKIKELQDDQIEVDYRNNLDISLSTMAKSLGIPIHMVQRTPCPKEHKVLFKINTYQAIANPLYICFMFIHDKTRVNPLFEIFRLNQVLLSQSRLDVEFKEEYKKESKNCEDFAVNLIEQCRTFKEIKLLTDVSPEFEKKKKYVQVESKDEDAKDLTFLNLAIKGYNEKLVAHPYSQLCLNMVLYRYIYTIFSFEANWRDRGILSTVLYMVRHILLLPFLALAHIVAPCSRVTKVLSNPVVKYISHFWSNLFFITLLMVSAFQDTFDKEIMKPSIPEWLILVWLFGMIVQESNELLTQGRIRYFGQWWNAVSFVMIALFMTSYALRLMAYGITGHWAVLDPISEDFGPSSWYKIILLANSLFSMGMLLSFVTLSAALQMNDFLGPLQLSLYHLILDVLKFMVFFALIFVSFAFSLRKLYSHYVSTQKYMAERLRAVNGSIFNASDPETHHRFSKADTSFYSLFWSLFGFTDLTSFSTKDSKFTITKETGETLFAIFQVIAILVAINMLIAMMSKSFEDIADNAIMKWKVSRTRLMMFWVEKGSILPPPLNLIPNVYYIVRKLRKRFKCCEKGAFELDQIDGQELGNIPKIDTKRNRKLKEILKRYLTAKKNEDKVPAQGEDVEDPTEN